MYSCLLVHTAGSLNTASLKLIISPSYYGCLNSIPKVRQYEVQVWTIVCTTTEVIIYIKNISNCRNLSFLSGSWKICMYACIYVCMYVYEYMYV